MTVLGKIRRRRWKRSRRRRRRIRRTRKQGVRGSRWTGEEGGGATSKCNFFLMSRLGTVSTSVISLSKLPLNA